jgi:phosphoglycolate phosphatase-like HAD superfamily hydrolase
LPQWPREPAFGPPGTDAGRIKAFSRGLSLCPEAGDAVEKRTAGRELNHASKETTMLNRSYRASAVLASLSFLLLTGQAFGQQDQTDPLPSWNDGPTKNAILDFVRTASDKASPKYVPPEQRIVTFDQDGTLWVEHPVYTQVIYCLDRVPAVVEQKPELKSVEPFKTVLSGDREAIAKLPMKDLEEIAAVTLSGMTVEEFSADVKKWLATAKHPRWKRPYTELTYQPMLEVLNYFRANGFKTYIVTGGGQDFVRIYAGQVYGIPPEQVVGTAGGTKYGYAKDGRPADPDQRAQDGAE